MGISRQPFDLVGGPLYTADEYRKRVEDAEQERLSLRNSELEAQASPAKDPRERIGLWERVHALSLPLKPDHALVGVIARKTQLTIGQVREEQQRRADVKRPVPTDVPVR